MLANRHDDVFRHAQRREQGAILELHPVLASILRRGPPVQGVGVDTQHLDSALAGMVEADDGAQQKPTCRPRSPTGPTISPRNTSKSRWSWMILGRTGCVRRAGAARRRGRPLWSTICRPGAGGRSACDGLRHHTLASRKMIEKMASSTITEKIASTTDLVVSWPTLSALPWTCSPSKQPIMAMTARTPAP